MTTDNVQLQIQKKARRRLIGALVFVTVAAAALLLAMDPEQSPSSSDPIISIPQKGEGETPLEIRMDTSPPPVTDAEDIPPPPAIPPAPVFTPNETASPPPSPSSPPSPPVAVIRPRPETPAAQTPSRPPAPSTPSTKAPTKAGSDADRAAAILAGRFPDHEVANNTAGNASAGNAPHIILIGAFSDAANVANLQKKLGELKIPVYTETLGEKTRVRAGPFTNRAAAEKAQQKMESIGIANTKIVPQS